MPRIMDLLNSINSLVQFGLSSCNGRFGVQCQERSYSPSPFGLLEYNRTALAIKFLNEMFEGPSLIVGFDNE